jgi:hypothetical protein
MIAARTSVIGIILVTLGLTFCSLAFSERAAATPNGLSVSGAFVDLLVRPGGSYTHTMDIAAGAQPLDITVQARGLGEAITGEFQALTASADVSPYSGRPYITRIDGGQFHLAAWQSKTVTVHFDIPATIGHDTHYAALAVTSQQAGTAGVGSNDSILVPVVLTPTDAEMRRTGAITGASALFAGTGRDVKMTALVQNTGNRHYHAQAFFTLYDWRGQVLANLTSAPSATPLIPTFSQALKATYSLPANSPPLAPGAHYSAQILVQLDDGSWLPPFVVDWTFDRIFLPFVAGRSFDRIFLPFVANRAPT